MEAAKTKINIHNSSYNTAIVILNWNGLADTLECFVSIQKYCLNESFLIVLVDNDSKESINPLLETKWEIPILIIKNTENSGFAEGNNIGIYAAMDFDPQYILLLNNDTVLLDNLLFKMESVMDKHPKIGIAGAVNYYFSNPEKVWQAGAKVSLRSGKVQHLNVDPDLELVSVDYVPGSSIMFRSLLVPLIGVLDSNYFAYSEELDFCLRAKKEQFDVVFIPDAGILHKVGKSSSNPAKEYLRLRNKFYLFKKHASPGDFRRIFMKELFNAFVKAGKMLVKKKTTIYYTVIFYSLKDYSQKNFGKGNFELFLKR